MRVLLTFEEEHCVYGQAMAMPSGRFVRKSTWRSSKERSWRPKQSTSIRTWSSRAPPVPENLVDESPVRIELSSDPEKPSRFRVVERRWESTNPTLSEFLPVIEETERLLRRASGEQGEQDPTDT